jgi:hypothetical protein
MTHAALLRSGGTSAVYRPAVDVDGGWSAYGDG